MASAQSVAGSRVDSTSEDCGYAGDFTLTAGGVDIIVDVETTDSLEDIAQAINEAAQEWAGDNDSGVPLSAKILDNTLVLTSGTTGTAAAMTFSDDDGVLESLGVVETVEGSKDFADELQSATDAQIKLDGLTVTRPDNTIDDVLDGVSIE
jgi:flagellar hook-associated protein 2